MTRVLLRAIGGLVVTLVLLAIVYAGNVVAGLHATAKVDGVITGLGVSAPVDILRDNRGVPHIRARNEHDVFFAEGYVEGQDRLFQLDLLRRFVYGELAEILGGPALPSDEKARIVPVRAIVAKQWNRLDAHGKAVMQAFAEGVNAAARHESTPVEFRILGYQFEPWQPQDSLAVGFATVLDLTDDWNDVASRVGKSVPISDPCFDAPVMDGLTLATPTPQCSGAAARAGLVRTLLDQRPPAGSNEWAAGAAHTATGRALLANDPHLRLGIPGVWYLVDLSAPGYHVAGAALAGTPGVTLGHNDNIAWGATNGTVTALSVFHSPKSLDQSAWKTETFHVRFGRDATHRYYRAQHEFGTAVQVLGKKQFVLVRWSAYDDPLSPVPTFDLLARANDIAGAIAALRLYPGPTQNFEIADTSGSVAYQLAGDIPDDPIWGSGIHSASDLTVPYPDVPFDRLPAVAASREGIVWTSNNKMYGPDYPLRLTAAFAPPCRAFRVAQLLRARTTYDAAYFAAMQMDTLSVCERQLASYVPSLRDWDGEFTPGSDDATAVYHLRLALVRQFHGMIPAMLAARAKPSAIAALAAAADPSPQPWGDAGAVVVHHPLAALGFGFLNGSRFAGNGDAYTVHVQNVDFSQSFRAVWDVGNWDAGGITLPQGESGRPGSGHYTDEAAAWVAGRLLVLPYSTAAVDRVARDRLTLQP